MKGNSKRGLQCIPQPVASLAAPLQCDTFIYCTFAMHHTTLIYCIFRNASYHIHILQLLQCIIQHLYIAMHHTTFKYCSFCNTVNYIAPNHSQRYNILHGVKRRRVIYCSGVIYCTGTQRKVIYCTEKSAPQSTL